ncbi:hypothetical protein [Cellulomonas dongxiuzhuiae]|uniref:ATP-binding protein n=1 Tax=Cellulomonas dongxiuzhuiae TaxID=2819979 RepID=A0ABX8GHF4_9CELL|nr:hypothetical protein [Cellulomonas dongxiuzhuiae]MBO3093997.1 hypothetical protein [Cellulomonas dongxiuzhuiae]QWC15071.1 hypothetical protein KKR89_12110 [Cellulomonas dongxiuzhuiae]
MPALILTGIVMQHLAYALAVAYPERSALQRVLFERTGRRLDDIVSVNVGNTDMRQQLLIAASDGGWATEVFQLLQDSENLSVRQYVRLARDALDVVSNAVVDREDPFLVHRVAGRPFLDRTELRKQLTELLARDEKRVLVVTGERPCGKTYAWPFLDTLGRTHGFDPVLIDVASLPATERMPVDVVSNVARQLGLPRLPEVDPLAQGASQAQRLFTWLIGEARLARQSGAASRWLLVIDSLDKFPLPAETEELFVLMGKGAAENRIADLRVVLLGYEHQLPVDLSSWVLTDTFSDIDERALRDYFDFLLRTARGGGIGPMSADTAIEDAVRQVEEALAGADRVDRFSRLAAEVDRVGRALQDARTR